MTTVRREDWTVWSCAASVVVTNPSMLARAAAIVRDVVRQVDDACSRFRSDSELSLLARTLESGATVSPILITLVDGALSAAALTDGAVDPTLGNDLARLGYDRDVSELHTGAEIDSAPVDVRVTQRRPAWQDVTITGQTLKVPAGVVLDLGATAKAIAADLAANRVVEELGGGVLVSLGGDIATAGEPPTDGWEVLVQDTAADPSQQVSLAGAAGMATSSTQKRRWMSDGFARHHILDPRFGLPAETVWRTVTVASTSCLHANALSTASIVRGLGAVRWLEDMRVAARFVDAEGRIVTTSLWPADVSELTSSGGRR
jgi:thiamine biosynthesis lipoprotein